MKKYYSHSLGCKVNSYETVLLTTELDNLGYTKTDSPSQADVIILNTCSVTSTADQKSRQHIRSLKSKNKDGILLVMGCYSQSNAQLVADMGADIVLGSSNRHLAIDYINQFNKTHQKIVDVKPSVRKETYEEFGLGSFGVNARAYLKIQDGCDNFCSYCYIPQLRGNSRSRNPLDAINEAKRLAELGYNEIILTGIHIGAYGKDLGDGTFHLSTLIESILRKVPSIKRLRISSIEESEIDDHLIHLLKTEERIVPHLHIPLQSGSSSVLKRMKRKYDTDAFLSKLDEIRMARPGIAITTDVIVGFPLETEEEFLETMEFCKKANFSEIHVFPYSSRPKTYAATLPQLDPSIKKERTHRLIELSKQLREEYKKQFIGKPLDVLFESYDEEKHIAYGHTPNYLLVGVNSPVSLTGEIKTIIFDSSISSD